LLPIYRPDGTLNKKTTSIRWFFCFTLYDGTFSGCA